jgi:hypothetical protein
MNGAWYRHTIQPLSLGRQQRLKVKRGGGGVCSPLLLSTHLRMASGGGGFLVKVKFPLPMAAAAPTPAVAGAVVLGITAAT